MGDYVALLGNPEKNGAALHGVRHHAMRLDSGYQSWMSHVKEFKEVGGCGVVKEVPFMRFSM